MKTAIEILVHNLTCVNIWDVNIVTMISLCIFLIFCTLGVGIGFLFAIKLRSSHFFMLTGSSYFSLLRLTLGEACIGVTLAVSSILLPMACFTCMGGNRSETTLLGCFNSMSGDFLHSVGSTESVRGGRYGLCLCLIWYGVALMYSAYYSNVIKGGLERKTKTAISY